VSKTKPIAEPKNDKEEIDNRVDLLFDNVTAFMESLRIDYQPRLLGPTTRPPRRARWAAAGRRTREMGSGGVREVEKPETGACGPAPGSSDRVGEVLA